MKPPEPTVTNPTFSDPARQPVRLYGIPRPFLFTIAALLVCFSVPLYRLFRFALQTDLYSYVLLVPVVSVYLFVTRLKAAPTEPSNGSPLLGTGLAMGGISMLGIYAWTILSGVKLSTQDSVALTTFAFVFATAAASAFLLPKPLFRHAGFPLVFLVFMAPFPVAVEYAIEMFLQHGSAPPSYWFFKLAGTPVFREGLIFQLPGMTLQIAPECSGIRSTIVLFLTSLVASHLFLRSAWKRALLVGFVLPLALVRNGFRIFVIGELCVHIGPHMIDSVIHHRGGPIFFALSLVPFSVLVYFLVRSDRSKSPARPQTSVH